VFTFCVEVFVLPVVVAAVVADWVLVEELLVVEGVKIGSVLMSISGVVSLYSIR